MSPLNGTLPRGPGGSASSQDVRDALDLFGIPSQSPAPTTPSMAPSQPTTQPESTPAAQPRPAAAPSPSRQTLQARSVDQNLQSALARFGLQGIANPSNSEAPVEIASIENITPRWPSAQGDRIVPTPSEFPPLTRTVPTSPSGAIIATPVNPQSQETTPPPRETTPPENLPDRITSTDSVLREIDGRLPSHILAIFRQFSVEKNQTFTHHVRAGLDWVAENDRGRAYGEETIQNQLKEQYADAFKQFASRSHVDASDIETLYYAHRNRHDNPRIDVYEAIREAFGRKAQEFFREQPNNWAMRRPEDIIAAGYDALARHTIRPQYIGSNLLNQTISNAQKLDQKYGNYPGGEQMRQQQFYAAARGNEQHLNRLFATVEVGDICGFADTSADGQRMFVLRHNGPGRTPTVLKVIPISSGRTNMGYMPVRANGRPVDSESGGTGAGLASIKISTPGDPEENGQTTGLSHHHYHPRVSDELIDLGMVLSDGRRRSGYRNRSNFEYDGSNAVMSSTTLTYSGEEEGLNTGFYTIDLFSRGQNAHGTNKEAYPQRSGSEVMGVGPAGRSVGGRSGGCMRMCNIHAIQFGVLAATNMRNNRPGDDVKFMVYIKPEDSQYAKVVNEAASEYRRRTGRTSPYQPIGNVGGYSYSPNRQRTQPSEPIARATPISSQPTRRAPTRPNRGTRATFGTRSQPQRTPTGRSNPVFSREAWLNRNGPLAQWAKNRQNRDR